MQQILIASIRTDGGVQSRAAINPEYVTELAELVKDGAKLPPVDVYRDGKDVWMADGFHRLRAHEAAGVQSIRANVHKGGQLEAAWHSVGANVAHGLRRTNSDKRRAVEMALKMRPDASDRLIAQHCGVSHSTVAAGRAALKSTGQVGQLNVRTGKDGKVRRIPPPPTSERRPSPPPAPPQPPEQPPVAPPREARKDAVGREIPDHLDALFDSGEEIDDYLRWLSDIRSTVAKAEHDPLFAECDRQAVIAAAGKAYEELSATKPYAVCPWCLATSPQQEDCDGCKGRGAIGKWRYDNVVPGALKK